MHWPTWLLARRLHQSALSPVPVWQLAAMSHFSRPMSNWCIEDANEMNKLLLKAEEEVRGNAGIIFKAKKVVKVLSSTVLATMQCKHSEELKVAVEKYSPQLESITINGAVPDNSRPVPLAVLKNMLKD